MPGPPDPGRIRAVLLDIEGTTTPIDFVTRVLFPYARERVRDFLARRASEVRDDLALLFSEHEADERAGRSPPAWRRESPPGVLDSAAAYVHWLMDRDRKSTALKALQGRIWEEGYDTGQLRGQVYPDVPRAFARWRGQGREIAIFSSGSVLAQKLLFSKSEAGDLTPYLRAYFDTTTGPKREAESYRKIARALGREVPSVLFLSDVPAELDAARHAGMATALCVREGNPPLPTTHPVIQTFDEVDSQQSTVDS